MLLNSAWNCYMTLFDLSTGARKSQRSWKLKSVKYMHKNTINLPTLDARQTYSSLLKIWRALVLCRLSETERYDNMGTVVHPELERMYPLTGPGHRLLDSAQKQLKMASRHEKRKIKTTRHSYLITDYTAFSRSFLAFNAHPEQDSEACVYLFCPLN